MKVLVLGGGGREHALAWKVAQSPLVTSVVAAPGNAGISEVATCIALDPEDGAAIVDYCKANGVGLVIVGPEAPLAAGVADNLAGAGVPVFGPSAAAARLEASKAFTKEVCDACGAPTAAWARFSDAAAAKAYLARTGAPVVVKADGLAAGKGVVVATTLAEAEAAVDDMLGGAFGSAGAEVVIEEFMPGEEASFFVLTDGETVLPLATAQDHKRAFDGDEGPNTGGMGAYSPAPVVTPEVEEKALSRIVRPVIAEMARRGTPYRGVLYAGLMIEAGEPRLVEFNVRFGDPECQVLMMRLASDIVPALMACAQGGLADVSLEWHADPALTVVMAARGYPGSYAKGSEIRGLDDAGRVDGVTVFHAGTRASDGRVLANGGRVLNVTAAGPSVTQARERAYRAVDLIDWPEGFCRRDIAWRALTRTEA
ncbi:phosphoribosylamine--glycine ligase [Limibaculum sp. M0105]|uniref:Phosphoribosylamine--glycine ligase n=1 Tax=Thermohalobaculum xanthum TaxID=2753746 RepID=A0A8J7M6T2_9RHOB|nr:phosphoribosylamine--glycine ligase [Thermohalobaculum xanthum]MBK0398589.1 phosphoribosylamine--glycine ligase [Thermohalobaculum xanthum]